MTVWVSENKNPGDFKKQCLKGKSSVMVKVIK